MMQDVPLTNDTNCWTAVTKAAFNKKTLSTNKLNQNSRNNVVKFLYLEYSFCMVLII
jgi:hypothetical protein